MSFNVDIISDHILEHFNVYIILLAPQIKLRIFLTEKIKGLRMWKAPPLLWCQWYSRLTAMFPHPPLSLQIYAHTHTPKLEGKLQPIRETLPATKQSPSPDWLIVGSDHSLYIVMIFFYLISWNTTILEETSTFIL